MGNPIAEQHAEQFVGSDAVAKYLTARGWTRDADLPVWHRSVPGMRTPKPEEDAFAWQVADDRSSGREIVSLEFRPKLSSSK